MDNSGKDFLDNILEYATTPRKEIWKDIPEYEGYYQVSNIGNVRSVDRYVNGKSSQIFINGRLLKQQINHKGYLKVHLFLNGKVRNCFVHRLVLITFKSINNLTKYQCNHRDSNKWNNYVGNLEWVTPSENIKHYYKNARNNI